ncbi:MULTISPECIES: bacteriorhodopsin [Halorubrum]|uniref:Rhodopsin n=1 Tax=Halorubrum ezzemoulense TaxID=337243 RepID=A0A256KFV7_HALEZ|nr:MULTISPECIES: bacteriorhodopsin [Halorubrum]OYR78381.1 rhodopsin [Halorubrum ezzemoulense]OYR80038.1 rhodopsin [Halorubrum ezzemoulense]PHQ43121.1 rhodopsin [Halorubrum sp. C191]QAY19264.1 rhodopsin [Halorubrum ezzemoulense]
MTGAVSAAYWIAAVAFLVGLGITAALYAKLGESEDRGRLAALAVIPGFAGLAYAGMALGIGTVTVNGAELVGLRYVDWIVTTPLLVGFIGYVAGASRRAIAGVMLADALMIAFGAGAVVTGGTLKWVLFGVSSIFHVTLFAYLYVVFPRAVPDDPMQRGLFSLLKNHVGLLWLAYPFVWLMGPAGIGFTTGVGAALTYAFLDVLAKVPYVYFFYARRQAFTEVVSAATADREDATDAVGDGAPTAAD